MALDPIVLWKERLLAMKPSSSPSAGAKELAEFYGDMGDKVQGVTGKAGIFTFNRSVFAAQLVALGFTPTPSTPAWANVVSTAWLSAVLASVITPGTVGNPAWTASKKDTVTAPTGATTIITASVAKDVLFSRLVSSVSSFGSNSDEGIAKYAQAFRDATLVFKFLTIGLALAPPGAPIPIPIVTASK